MTIRPDQRNLFLEAPIPAVAPVIVGRPQSAEPMVRGADGKFYELKLARKDAPNLAANEMIGAFLIRGLGFSGPQFRSVVVDGSTVDAIRRLPTCGSRYVIPLDGVCCAVEAPFNRGYEIHQWVSSTTASTATNNTDLIGMFLLDVWARQQEQRQCLYLKNGDTGSLEAYFINNSHMFGGSAWHHLSGSARLPACSHLGSFECDDPLIDDWICYLQCSIPPLLEHSIENLPSAWHGGDVRQLERLCYANLRGLSDSAMEQLNLQNQRVRISKDEPMQPFRYRRKEVDLADLDRMPYDDLEDVLAPGRSVLE